MFGLCECACYSWLRSKDFEETKVLTSKEDEIKMKKFMIVLLGGLALSFMASVASADTLCASVNGGAGNSGLGSGTDFAPNGTAVNNGNGTWTLTCTVASLSAGQTLSSLTIDLQDDATFPATTGSIITWTWTYNGTQNFTVTPGMSSSETSANNSSYNSCVSTGNNTCDVDTTFTLNPSISGPGSSGTISFIVSSAAGGNGGVANSGAVDAALSIGYIITSSSPTPEPGTIALIGSGLIGLGLLSRKKKA